MKSLRVKLPKSAEGPTVELRLLIATVCQAGFAEPVEEYRFDPVRLWRFDMAWPELRVAFEREGGKWVKVKCRCGAVQNRFVSRHHDRDGMAEDAAKYNAAAVADWLVIRATPPMLKDGTAVRDLIDALKFRLEANR